MKNKLIILSILSFVILSFSVLALKTPADAFSGVSDAFSSFFIFLRDLFTGNANMQDTTFVVFILYFIVFFALYVELLSRLPGNLFKGDSYGSGGLSIAGKWFAFAVSLITTIAIFMSDLPPQDLLESIINPFGLWGAFVIAGLVAYLTYVGIKDMDLFEEQVMGRAAMAAAVGVTFAGMLLSLPTLLGWGFTILILVFGFEGGRAFLKWRAESSSSGGSYSPRTPSTPRTSGSPSVPSTPKKAKKKKKKIKKVESAADKLMEYELAEFAWLKELKKEIESFKEKVEEWAKVGLKRSIGVPSATEEKEKKAREEAEKEFNKIKPRREERNLRRMFPKLTRFQDLLNEIEKEDSNVTRKKKLNTLIEETLKDIQFLVSHVAKGSELDDILDRCNKILKTKANYGGPGDGAHHSKELSEICNKLISIIDQSIKFDEAAIINLRKVKKLLKVEEKEVATVVMAEEINEE